MLIEVNKFNGSSSEWNSMLMRFEGYNIYQSYEWGDQKKLLGWKVSRFFSEGEAKSDFMIQFQYKPLPFAGAIVWIPGGFMGEVSKSTLREIMRKLGVKFYMARVSFNYIKENIASMQKQGWRKAYHSIESNQSMFLNTNREEKELLMSLSKNWRHNLNRSGKKDIIIEEMKEIDPVWLRNLYSEIEERKKLDIQFSKDEITAILKKMKQNVRFYKAYNSEGEILAIRGVYFLGEKAWDLFAITTHLGRKCYASYAVLWKLIQDCISLKVKNFDLSGIDPKNNKGTYNFKKGTGAVEVVFSGEWDCSNVPFLRQIFNLYLKFN